MHGLADHWCFPGGDDRPPGDARTCHGHRHRQHVEWRPNPGLRTVSGIGLGEVAADRPARRLLPAVQPVFRRLLPLVLAGERRLSGLARGQYHPACHRAVGGNDEAPTSVRPFFDGLAITVSNPTALLFYSAFFVPFVRDGKSVAAAVRHTRRSLCVAELCFRLSPACSLSTSSRGAGAATLASSCLRGYPACAVYREHRAHWQSAHSCRRSIR